MCRVAKRIGWLFRIHLLLKSYEQNVKLCINISEIAINCVMSIINTVLCLSIDDRTNEGNTSSKFQRKNVLIRQLRKRCRHLEQLHLPAFRSPPRRMKSGKFKRYYDVAVHLWKAVSFPGPSTSVISSITL